MFNCNITQYSCIVKKKHESIQKHIGFRKLASELHMTVKGMKSPTHLASGNFLLEMNSREMLNKALNINNLILGGLQVQINMPTDIQTNKVVIHGVPLDENLKNVQRQLDYASSKGACLVGAARLQNKYKQNSREVELTFSGSCPLEVRLINTSISFKIEIYLQSTLRCFRCQGFDHISRRCTNGITCGRCGGQHEYKEYRSELVIYANCGNNHKAHYRDCNEYSICIQAICNKEHVPWKMAEYLFKLELKRDKDEQEERVS